jgi:NADPH:quinone reductase
MGAHRRVVAVRDAISDAHGGERMKAIGVFEFGGPDALQVVEVPEPQVGPGQVRIRVHAATVNPTDTGLRSGRRTAQLRDIPPPHVPGMEAAGVVDQIGDDTATDLAVGDHAMAIVLPSGTHGGYAEYVVVPAESVTPVPAGASDIEAATLPMNALTARLALDHLDLRPGDQLAITGAAGALGGYVIQLAKADGFQVVADASPADEQLVRDLGADVVVPRGTDFAKHVRDVLPEGADALVDAAILNNLAVAAVRSGGRIATVRGYRGEPDRDIAFYPVMVRTYALEHDKLDQLRQQVEAGQLSLRVARTFPAEQAADAHRALEAGGIRGRIVLWF